MRATITTTTLTMSLGFLLVQLDVSIINVALAAMGADLHTGVTGLQWVVDAYAITFASLLLSAGALGDRIGARRTFVTGLSLFVVASLACALAPTADVLILARALQGAGASTLVPCSLALLSHAARDDTQMRARAVALWTAAGSVGLALGPVLGGALITLFGWRSVFAVNLPIGATAIWLAGRFTGETPTRRAATDWTGQILAIVSLFCLTGAVIEAGPLGWSSPIVLTALGLAITGFAGFVRAEQRSADAMLPLGFFRQPTFAAATAIGFLLNLSLYGALFLLGLYFQQILHWTPFGSGIALLPFAIAIFSANLAAGWLAAVASPRAIMTGGLLVAALGVGLLRGIDAATPYGAILPGLVLLPLGIGLAVPMMTASLLGTVPQSRTGIASGVLNAVRQAGGAIGIALFGALLAGTASGLADAFALAAALLVAAALASASFISASRTAMVSGMARR